MTSKTVTDGLYDLLPGPKVKSILAHKEAIAFEKALEEAERYAQELIKVGAKDSDLVDISRGFRIRVALYAGA